MSIPAIIILVYIAIKLLTAARAHGKKHQVESNFWVELAGSMIFFGLLYWGGFFK